MAITLTDALDLIIYIILNITVFLSIAIVYYLYQSRRIAGIKRMRKRRRGVR